MADRVGQQLGNYRLVRLLGRGGFAEVYLAENVQLGSAAAVKVLHAQLASEDIEHFRNEARTIARLVHPHIVRVFDFNVQEGVPFLVMDYAPNGTLRQRYPKGTKLPIGTIVPYVRQVADALYYAHEQRVIHRDIKPENMLLGRQQEIVLSDFGIATISQSSRYQNTQDIVGTVAYMAPEQIQGKPRPASDQYALGIAVYEWLTGDRPFHGSSTEVAIQHAVATPQPMHERVPISPAVEHVVMTALDKDPNRRFAHVRAFANALEQASTMEQSAPLFQPPMGSSTMPTYAPPTAGTPPPNAQPAMPSNAPTFISAPSGPQYTAPSYRTSSSTENFPSNAPTFISTPPGANTPRTGASPAGTVLSVYRGHSGWVYAAAWAPDNRRIASAGTDGAVHTWDSANGEQVAVYRQHTKRVNALIWLPDGERIASASNDKTVHIWEAASGRQLSFYAGHTDWVNALASSPDGRRIISSGNDKHAYVWDAGYPPASPQPLLTYRNNSAINAVAWSPDGRRVVTGGNDKAVQVWDANNGSLHSTYQGHSGRVNAVAWSPDGSRIASASDDKTVRVWDAANGNLLLVYSAHTQIVNAVIWSPDNRQLVSASYKAAHVWDAASGNTRFSYGGHSDWVRSVSWSPDGSRIASAGDDKTVQVWAIG